MKQVTIAGVKDFINEIEKGGLSLREEYVLACLRELVAVTEQRDALVVEAAALKAGQLFFMYSDETGFEIHKTQDAAIASAKDMIAACREEAAQDGWPEDADTICWGVIMQKAIEIDFEEPSEKNGWIGWSEYKLNPELETPATDAARASLRAEAIEKCADDMTSENNIGGHEVDAMYAYARRLRESKGESKL
ncbi:hypothetical protein AAIG33_04315 [Phytobacter ursingii]|uniref:hypothetical protein n=1 Tax=Phytobacter ursingii TaxID=1972431 RepID=UPI0031B7DBEE